MPVFFALLMTSVTAYSQSEKYQPAKGFWVIESNIHQRENFTVHFYDDKSNSIYDETVTGRSFNIHRKRTLRFLKAGLDKALIAWNINKVEVKNGDMMATMLRKKK